MTFNELKANSMKDDEIMFQLKEILVGDEKKRQEEFHSELKKIEKTLYDKKELKAEIDPIIDERIEDLRNQFDQLFGDKVQQQIKNSEEELIVALTPVMGKLIQKWIAYEFNEFNSSINEYIKNSTSIPEIIYWKLRSFILPRGTAGKILMEAIDTAKIIDIFIIQKETGFMMAKYSDKETMNQNQIAGMMTALINFGQDALKVGVREKIEQIKYELYTVNIYNDFNYYAAILFEHGIQGNLKYVEPVKKSVARFIQQEIIPKNYTDSVDVDTLSKQLKDFLRKDAVC